MSEGDGRHETEERHMTQDVRLKTWDIAREVAHRDQCCRERDVRRTRLGERYASPMSIVLLVADQQSVVEQVHAALASANILIIDHPDSDTAAVTAYHENVDAVLVDMQVGSMGAMAVARDVRAKAGSAEEIPVTILLDREADSFLARRSGAKNWLLKSAPISELQAAVATAPTIAK
jgi:CheY-like chemotaxis protein